MTKSIPYEAFLKLETGSHTAYINQLLATADGKTLISKGRDKTIRIWDVETKKQIGMLLGEVGKGSEDGSVEAMTLSPDGKYLIALVWLYPAGTQTDDERETDVRVYELATGNLHTRFRYAGTLWDIDFSAGPKGEYLALVGNPKKSIRQNYVLVYDTKKILGCAGKSPAPRAQAALYKNDALVGAYLRFVPDIDRKSRGYRIVASTRYKESEYQGALLWFDLTRAGKLKNTAVTNLSVKPQGLAVSREFTVITGEGDDDDATQKIYCYDLSGKLVSTTPCDARPGRLKFSQDGSQLIVGQRGDDTPVQVKVYENVQGHFHVKSTYYGHDAKTHHVELLKGGTAVSAGGSQNAIHFWNPAHSEGEASGVIKGLGRVIHAVGINQQEQIGIGIHEDLLIDDDDKNSIVLQRMFDLRNMQLTTLSIPQNKLFQRSQRQAGNEELKWRKGKKSGKGPNLWLLSAPDVETLLTGTPDPKNKEDVLWYHATTYGFTEKRTIVTGETDGTIRVAPRRADGTYAKLPWRMLNGHEARVLSHAASDKWLVSAGADQIIRLWYLEDVEQNVMTDLQPALNFFVGSDDEWVIWTKNGYYTASQRGDRRFGYHINRGADKEALYFPSDRFIKTFLRPDIIQAVIEHGSEERAKAKGVAIPSVDVAKILPPIVEFTGKEIIHTNTHVTFNFTVESLNPDEPIKRVWVIQNGQFAWSSEKPQANYRVKLKLLPGRNRFKILAENDSAKSLPLISDDLTGPAPKVAGRQKTNGHTAPEVGADKGASATVKNPPPALLENGILYLLAVGVSTFERTEKDGGLKPLHYAHVDAIAMYNAFGKVTLSDKEHEKAKLHNKAFKSVEAKKLLNAHATKEAIMDALKEMAGRIKKKPSERDTLFVFLSGHGVRYTGESDLYFANHDIKYTSSELMNTGLSLIDLGKIITSVPANIILAIDACHSGLAGGAVAQGLNQGLDPNEIAKRIYAINENGMYILNAARSEESAKEGNADMGHGVFTKAILDTLKIEGALRTMNIMNLIGSVQERARALMSQLESPPSPVCRMYGDLLPLVIYEK